MAKQRRKRGVILTPQGLEKLQNARSESEYEHNFGERYTYEKLSEITYLDINTIKRVLKCKEGVDKRTLERFFIGFDLKLSDDYYTTPNPHKRKDLRETLCIADFQGRTAELRELEQWILKDRCRLVSILGIGGVGKTALSVKLTNQIGDKFDCVIWRSLKNAPPLEKLLIDLLEFLAAKPLTEAELHQSNTDKITRLLDYLRSLRCLLVLDNPESLLCGNSLAGICSQEHEQYGQLFRRIGESTHQSCLLLNSREKLSQVAILEGDSLPVRSLRLTGLKQQEGTKILQTTGLNCSESQLHHIIRQCSGNASALKIIATTIKDIFEGNINEFLSEKMVVFGDIYQLLDEQFERLSALEQKIVYRLAIHQQPVTFSQLREQMGLAISKFNLMEGLESLYRRSLIESQHSRFTLESIVMEYAICRFAESKDSLALLTTENTS